MDISSLKVAELKDELKKRSLPVTGLKKELADRLQEAVDSEKTEQVEDVTNAENGEAEAEAQAQVVVPAADDVETRAPTQGTPSAIPAETAVTEPETQTLPEVIEEPNVPVTDADVKQVTLGDSEGDLGQAMQQAAEQGKQERKAEEKCDAIESSAMQIEQSTEKVEAAPETTSEAPKQSETEIMQVEADEHETPVGEKRKRESTGQDQHTETQEKKARIEEEGEINSDAQMEAPAEDSTPNPLPHALHPPTCALYIDNFRRPLDVGELTELLETHGDLDEDLIKNGFWTSGVKSHIYCVYKTAEQATTAALAIHDLVFQPIAKVKLHVEFVPASLVPSLISQEEAAFKNGRKQLALTIREVSPGQGHEGSSHLIELTTANTPGARNRFNPPPITPVAGLPGIAGIGGLPVQGAIPGGPRGFRGAPVPAPNAPSNAPLGPRGTTRPEKPAYVKPDRESRGFIKTKTRPVLYYREAPQAKV